MSFVGAVELAMWLARSARLAPSGQPGAPLPAVAADAEAAARAALQASIAASNPISQRALASRFGLTRSAAARLYREAAAAANGSAGLSAAEISEQG